MADTNPPDASVTQGNQVNASHAALDNATPSTRKARSLSALCESFLGLYCQEPGYVVHVDTACKDLGVERRRIYDIINTLQGLGLVTKYIKSQYVDTLGVYFFIFFQYK